MVFMERTYSVLVVSSSEKFKNAAAALLPVSEYYPVLWARSVAEAKRTLLEQSFDIVMINTPVPDDFGLRLGIDVSGGGGSVVLLFVKSEIYEEICVKAQEHGVMAIAKPVSRQFFRQTMHLLCAARERLRRAEERQISVEEKIAEIRLVNRAKWLLIEHAGMTEDEAHRHIEKQSMDRRAAKREVAEEIIEKWKDRP